MRYFELRVGGLGPFCYACLLGYVAGIRAFNDQQLVEPLLKQIYFAGVVCAAFLVELIYFNLTTRLMSVCEFW